MLFPGFDSSNYYFNLIALILVILPLYVIIRKLAFRRALLSVSGAYLLYIIAPRLMVFYVLFWLAVFVTQYFIAITKNQRLKLFVFLMGLGLSLSPMIVWKLWDEQANITFNLIGNDIIHFLSLKIWEIDMARTIIIPIGISFATFRAVDILVKIYIEKFKVLSLDRIFFYGFFPAVQIVGPIIEYEEIEKHGNDHIQPTPGDIFNGIIRIAFGFIKIFILGAMLKESTVVFQLFPNMHTYQIWMSLIAYTWFFYLNFSGYSDLSIGMSRLFGIRLNENFNYPFFSKNISIFWGSWHMSLSKFAQRNVFIPLGGYRKNKQYIAMFVTMMVIALWHDLTFSFILFGCYHGAGLIVYRALSDVEFLNHLKPTMVIDVVKISFTYLYVAISFPLIVLNLDTAWSFYLSLFGFNL